MAKAMPVMLAKAIAMYQEDKKAKLAMGVPGISAAFRLPDGNIEEVPYDGLIAYYQNSQKNNKGKGKNKA